MEHYITKFTRFLDSPLYQKSELQNQDSPPLLPTNKQRNPNNEEIWVGLIYIWMSAEQWNAILSKANLSTGSATPAEAKPTRRGWFLINGSYWTKQKRIGEEHTILRKQWRHPSQLLRRLPSQIQNVSTNTGIQYISFTSFQNRWLVSFNNNNKSENRTLHW